MKMSGKETYIFYGKSQANLWMKSRLENGDVVQMIQEGLWSSGELNIMQGLLGIEILRTAWR